MGNILDMLLAYVIMRCNTQSCIKSYCGCSIIMHKLPKDEAVKDAWIKTILKGRKQVIQESLRTFITTPLLGWLISPSPVFN